RHLVRLYGNSFWFGTALIVLGGEIHELIAERNRHDRVPSIRRRNGEKAGEDPSDEGGQAICSGRSQRRSGKSGNANASDEAADLWKSHGGDSAYDRIAKYCHRSSSEDSGLGGLGG